MKKARQSAEELRAECKLSDFKTRGVRGKYLKRYRAGTNLVLLTPDVARAFPTAKAVSDALSGLMRAGIRPTGRSTTNGRKRKFRQRIKGAKLSCVPVTTDC